MSLLEPGHGSHIDIVDTLQVGIVGGLAAVLLLVHLLVQRIALDRVEHTQVIVAFEHVGLQLHDLLERVDALVVILQRVEDTSAAEPQVDVLRIVLNGLVDQRHEVGGIAHALLRGVELHQAVEDTLVLRELLDTRQQSLLGLDHIGFVGLLLAVKAVEEVVVDVTLLVGIALLDGLGQQLGALDERFGIVGAVDRQQVARIVEQRGIGLAVSGARLGLVGRFVGLGSLDVVARVDTGVTDLRAEIADLLQPLLDLVGRLGVQLVSLVVSLDGLLGSVLHHPLRLLPRDNLVVLDIGGEIVVHPRIVLHAVERLLGRRLGLADSQFQHRGVHVDEEALRRLDGHLVEGLTAVDPRCGLDSLLLVGDVGIALFDLGEKRFLVHFLGLHGGNCYEQRRESRQNRFLHSKLKF